MVEVDNLSNQGSLCFDVFAGAVGAVDSNGLIWCPPSSRGKKMFDHQGASALLALTSSTTTTGGEVDRSIL